MSPVVGPAAPTSLFPPLPDERQDKGCAGGKMAGFRRSGFGAAFGVCDAMVEAVQGAMLQLGEGNAAD